MIKSQDKDDVVLGLELYKNIDIADRNIINRIIAKALLFDNRKLFYKSIGVSYPWKELLSDHIIKLIDDNVTAANLYKSYVKLIYK